MDTPSEQAALLASAKRRANRIYREMEALRKVIARLEDTVATNDTPEEGNDEQPTED